MWKIETRSVRQLPFGTVQVKGWARHVKAGETGFFITYNPAGLLILSTNPTETGNKLIEYFARVLKQRPTLKYHDRKPNSGYEDYTAEWYRVADLKIIMERMTIHKAIGYESEEKG